MKEHRLKRLFPVIAALIGMMAIVAMTGCEDDQQYERPTSYLKVRMHDSTGNYAHVNVHIIAAEVHVTDTFDSGGWQSLDVNSGIYDLLRLQNGVDTVLANETEIPAGKISQLRLLLGDSNSVVLSDSTTIKDLEVPSAQSSGLKINVHEYLEPDQVYEITLDFDVHHSIVVTGNERYQLKPVIKVDSVTAI